MQTDSFIQSVIKEKFKETTVITIAHRLNTIADYDKIFVMEKGSVAEMGAPFELIEKRGIFYDMVINSGNAEQIITKAKLSLKTKTI